MKPILSTVCAATIALSTLAPLQAAPLFVPQTTAAESNIVQVNHTRRHERELRRDRREDRRDFRRDIRRGDHRYYRGYRGYSRHRPGYRQHDGWWFPLAAFAAGAIISNSQPRVVVRRGLSNAHVEWCYDRYRSYRASDNTFQPYNGPRKQCYSPYS